MLSRIIQIISRKEKQEQETAETEAEKSSKVQIIKRVTQLVTKAKKGKAGLNMESSFTVYVPNFLGYDWRWEISTKSYIAYKSRSRQYCNGLENYWKFVTPTDVYIDTIVSDIIDDINKTNKTKAVNRELEYAQTALDFVHKFPYQTKKKGYVKYPLETLCENSGNCVDNSVLLASMLINMSIDCCFIVVPEHVLVGVCVAAEGAYVESNGKKYYLANAASSEWLNNKGNIKIGDGISDDLSKAQILHKPKKYK